MKREELKKLKQTPEKYKKYLETCRRYNKNYLNKLSLDEKRKKKHYKKINDWRKEFLKTPKNKEKIKNYYTKLRASAKLRYKKQVFKNLVKCSNRFYKDSKITPFDLWKIAKRQKLICPVTGQKLTTENISLDHIIPRSKGGLNIPSNIRLTTKSVNFSKRNMTDKEFYDLCINVVKYNSLSA